MLATYKGLKIDLPYDVIQIEYLSLEEAVNEHIQLHLKVVAEEDKIIEYINREVINTKVTIYEHNRHVKREIPIFQGKIINVKMNYEGNFHQLELTCISFTYDFDIKRISRTFCDLDLTYNQVIEKVLSAYPKKDYQDMITDNKKIKDFLLQYEETDWTFIKRLATHFEALLLPDAGADYGRFYLGLPRLDKEVEIEKEDYQIIKDLESYSENRNRTASSIMIQDYTTWQITANTRLYLGEEIIFNKIKCQVIKVRIHTYKGELRYVYTLQPLKGVRSIYATNPKIYGMSIPAIVKERKGNSVRVHFEVDDSYIPRSNNKYFTYALESSAWYCMPVEESKVHIYFPTKDEKDAIAIHAIRTAGDQEKYYNRTSNPVHKSFSNITGSEMKMTPKNISFAADDAKSISMILQKSGDIKVTGENITLGAKENIEMGIRNPPPDTEEEPMRPRHIKISAKENLIIKRNPGSNHTIDMTEETQLIATFVKVNASIKNPPSIPASAFEQSTGDPQLIKDHNAGTKKQLQDKLNQRKVKAGMGTVALAVGGAAVLAAGAALTGGVAVAVAAVAGATGAARAGKIKERINGGLSKTNSLKDDLKSIIKYGHVIVLASAMYKMNNTAKFINSLKEKSKAKVSLENYLKSLLKPYIKTGVHYISANDALKEYARKKGEELGAGISTLGDRIQKEKAYLVNLKNRIFAGDPVDVATGSLYIPATDLVLPDIPVEFKIERKYDSINRSIGVFGKGWTFNYQSNLQVQGDTVEILCPEGHIESFHRKEDQWENIKKGSHAYGLRFDSQKNQWEFTNRVQKYTYNYNIKGQLTKVVDNNNNQLSIAYEGNAIKHLKTFTGHVLNFMYEKGKIIEIRDQLGRTIQYKYTEDYLTHVVHLNHGITKYDYDEQGYIKAITDQNGNTYTRNQFDHKGRVIQQEYTNGDTCTITYNDDNRETQFYYSQSQRQERYRYNQDSLVTHIFYEDDSCQEYRYDQYQNRILEKDRNGNITKREYNACGNLLKEELPNGLITTYTYDEKQNLIKRADNKGGEALYTHDMRGNVTKERRKINTSLWQTIQYEYDIYGRITKITDPLDNTRTFEYEIGEKIQPGPRRIQDSESNIYEYTYDEIGRNNGIITQYGEVEFGYNRLNYITYIKDPLGNITTKYYDKMGNLIGLVTPNNYNSGFENGEAYEYEYDFLDRLIQIKDPLGNTRKNIRDSQGNIIKEINPNYYKFSSNDGIGIEYKYDKDNRKIKTIYPDGGIERYYYDSQGNLIKHVTPEYYNPEIDEGKGYSYQYDSMNRLIAIIGPEGEKEKSYQYDLYGNIIQEIDREGNHILYQYDLIGNLLEKREPLEKEEGQTKYKITLYEYDKMGNKVKEKHGKEAVGQEDYPNDYHELAFSYDKNNRLIQVKDKYGAKVEYRYDCLNQKTYESHRINDSTEKNIYYQYDEAGRLIQRKEEIDGRYLYDGTEGRTSWIQTQYEYDKNGNITQITTPKGNRIKRIYDKIDRIIEENQIDKENGIHRKYSYNYDKASNLIKITDYTDSENIITREFQYDDKNRLTHKHDGSGNTTRIYYDKNDRVVKEILPEQYNQETDDGKGTTYSYNLKGQVVEVKNPLGEIITKTQYDYKGNIKATIDGANNKIEYTYNLLGQIKEIITPNSRQQNKAAQSYIYDTRGNITGIEDGNGSTTTYRLDDWGRITEIINPEGGVEKYTYDYAGNITSTTDANENTIAYSYNSLNKIYKMTDQEGGSQYFYYDAEGNLAEHVDRKENHMQYGYNIDRNLTYRKGYDKTREYSLYQSFSYNSDGTLQQAKTQDMIYSYSYTKDRRLKKKQASGKTLISYSYNKNNQVTQIQDITGKTTKYHYDPARRLKEILDQDHNKLAAYTYNPDNSIKTIQYGNGITTSYTYDGDKNITNLITKTTKGQALTDYNYQYDLNGNRLQKAGTNHQSYYSYDRQNRLTKAIYDGREESFTYDNAGNRLTKITDNTVEKYTYNVKNQLLQIQRENGITSYCYDQQGNTIKEVTPDGANIFEYNAFNQQIKAVIKEDNTLISRYDPEGLRAEIEENKKLTKFIFHKGNILVELDKEENPVRQFAWGHEVISADLWNQHNNNYDTYYYQQDEQGSTLYITDQQENIQNSYHYDAFGAILESKENISNRITYTGQQYDNITQQYYLRARHYNPIIGRFTQEDTYLGDGLNLYAYCQNNPVTYYDPSGFASAKKENAFEVDAITGAAKPTYNREPGPTLMEAAEMADHVYSGKKGDRVPGGWEMVDVYKVGSLRMGVYERKHPNGTMEYVLANKGTTFYKPRDWQNNVQQPFGNSLDMKNSIKYSIKFVENNPNAHITFVGHSKGGAEAAANAVRTDRNAILFNPATVNLNAYKLDSSAYTAEMTAYIVKGDALNNVFGLISAPIDQVVYLPSQHTVRTPIPTINKVNAVRNHLMGAVKDAIEEWERKKEKDE